MVSRFSDSGDDEGRTCRHCGCERGITTKPVLKSGPNAAGARAGAGGRDLIDAGIGHEDSYAEQPSTSSTKKYNSSTRLPSDNNYCSTNTNTTPPLPPKRFSKKQAKNTLQKKRNPPKPSLPSRLSFSFSWLVAKMDLVAVLKKRKIHHGKRPINSRPVVVVDPKPCRSLSVAVAVERQQAIEGEQALFTRRPQTPPVLFSAEGKGHTATADADATPSSHMHHLPRTMSRHAMRLGRGGQRELVISDVMAVERWVLAMRRYVVQKGDDDEGFVVVTRLQGPVQCSERFTLWMMLGGRVPERRCLRMDGGGEEDLDLGWDVDGNGIGNVDGVVETYPVDGVDRSARM